MSRTLAVLLTSLALGLSSLAHAIDAPSLDRASASELAALDGVDAPLAEAIVTLRDQRGGLGSVEELRILPGITDEALQALRNGTTVTIEMPVTPAKVYDSPEQVLAEFKSEPTVQDVQGWANDYAKTSPELVKRLLAQSSSFAALPELTLRYRFRDDWDQDFIYVDQGGASRDALLEDAGTGQYNQIDVQARWRLGELVMSSERIRIVSESQDIAKLRDKMLTQVTQLFFDRRRHQVDMLLSPASSVRDRVEDELRLMELTAGIDALTGGRFSASLRGGGQ